MKFVSRKPGGVDIMTLAAAGLIKPVAEGMLAPFVGNGTIVSGGVKILGAGLVRNVVGGGTLGNAVQIALALDGAEDIFRGLLGGALPALGGGNAGDDF